MTLLHIDSSARQSSTSRRLTAQFVEAWRTAHPGDTIITRDLATTTLPAITDDWMATYSMPSVRTPAQRQYLALSDELIDELLRAETRTDVGLGREMLDRYLAMYANDDTLDYGARGREAISTLFRRGHEAGVIPHAVNVRFAP